MADETNQAFMMGELSGAVKAAIGEIRGVNLTVTTRVDRLEESMRREMEEQKTMTLEHMKEDDGRFEKLNRVAWTVTGFVALLMLLTSIFGPLISRSLFTQ